MKVKVVDYALYPYEEQFLIDEVKAAGGEVSSPIRRAELLDIGEVDQPKAANLTYISGVVQDDGSMDAGVQQKREAVNGHSKRTQSRRYGPHGLHEYKGRYNPQTPRSIMLQHFGANSRILDPFMGSGTTMVEARDLGHAFAGIELNPMAHKMALAKKYYEEVDDLPDLGIEAGEYFLDWQRAYLEKWFPVDQLRDLESLLLALSKMDERPRVIAEIILSNLLREHSLQEPSDLRIRRRPAVPDGLQLRNSFQKVYQEHQKKHDIWHQTFGAKKSKGIELCLGTSTDASKLLNGDIDGTVCSPPYASALPYVDTYRLSMVALGLIGPTEILKTEKSLIGARDISEIDKNQFDTLLSRLPADVSHEIKTIQQRIEGDASSGFRRRAVPYALAKYAGAMLAVLREVYKVERSGAMNFWVLGSNKVKLDGEWYTIRTPELMGHLAQHAGFNDISLQTLQAYHRYNLHSKNSINEEQILIFHK